MSLKKLIESIKKHKRFLITTHVNPEGDAFGSELAFYFLLKALGKQAVIVNEDKVPAEYNFLPGIANVNSLSRKVKHFDTSAAFKLRPSGRSKDMPLGINPEQTPGSCPERNRRISPGCVEWVDFDCFVALDCSDPKRYGKVAQLGLTNKASLNIDHHISNKFFADVNWVEPGASSTSEMIYKLYKKMRLPLNKDIAMLLYVGILTDTGSFRYVSTSSYTHLAAADLMRYGLNAAEVYRDSYENIPFENMKLLATIISDLRRKYDGKVVWFQAQRGIFKDKKDSFDLAEHVLSFARAIKGVEVVVLFKENLGLKNSIRVNFRSQGKVDVNMVARDFGGGGHKTASGATINGSMEQVTKRVLSRLGESL